ncbi:MAG: hypothetical protein LBQ02_00010 [Candidatus Nomurabacteria bacterium]|nr:hypothetical protein [Candidatus Nomurabacteria bacterium]
MAVSIVLVGALTLVFYRSLAPTQAATSNITVIDNNQTITTTQDTNITTITRTSEVNVTDSSATYGYTLTAQISANNLTGATVTIGSDTSSECPKATPCALSSTPTNILITSNNNATNPDTGETTTFEVKITIPASSNIGSYTLDITYDETATPAPYIPPDQLTPTNTWVKAANSNTDAINSITGTSKDQFTVDLDANMIPIVNKADDDTHPSSWCNYDEKQWCNAVTVTAATLATYQSAPAGTIINEEDILGYFTYVPRYAYEVMRHSAIDKVVQAQNFDIHFEKSTTPKKTPADTCSSSDGSENHSGTPSNAKDYRTECSISRTYGAPTGTTWATHPAFSFDKNNDGDYADSGEELNGLWVGKFETTGTLSSPTVKPNSHANIYQYIGEFYYAAQRLGATALDPSAGNTVSGMTQNSHNLANQNSIMLKNDQWGAIAYLSSSTYGAGPNNVQINAAYPYGSADADGTSSRYGITGCGPSSSGSGFTYGDGTALNATTTQSATACSSNTRRAYHGTLGQLASSTNNVYGIYDLSGGVSECVMGNYNNTPSSTTYMATMPSANYFNNYPVPPFGTQPSWSSSSTEAYYNNDICTWSTCGGQALHETKTTQSVSSEDQSWRSDYSYFVFSNPPWFTRGGSLYNSSVAGVFASVGTLGNAYDSVGFRVVVGAF